MYSRFHSLLPRSGSLKSCGLSVNNSAIFDIRTWIFTGTSDISTSEVDFGTYKFSPSFRRFGSIPAHGMSFTTNGNAPIVDGKVFLIDERASSISVKINKENSTMITAAFIERHSIMNRVQKELCDNSFREKLFHGVPVIKELNGIMSGSGPKRRKNRKIIFRIGSSQHIKVIAEVITFAVGIPAYVTVRLAVNTVA